MTPHVKEVTVNQRDDRPAVLVGYDGSPGAEQALRWAVEEAGLRDLPLTVCHAWRWPYPFRPLAQPILEQVEAVGATVAEDGARRARELSSGLDVRTLLVQGATSAVLLEAARNSALVVLGSRGHGGFEELTVGSSAAQVSAHCVVPVIVVRPTLPPVRRDGGRIVVGVDGSPASRAALDFAFGEAELRGASVTAVCAWWDLGALPGPDRVPFTDPAALRQDAQARFEEMVASWASAHPKVATATEFVLERPRRAVAQAASGAILLVLGDRGVGSSPATRLGPVAQAALAAAPCPVATTPAPLDAV